MSFFSAIVLQQLRMARVEERVQLLLVAARLARPERVEVAVGGGEDDRDLLLDGQRLVLVLLQDLGQALAAGELRLRGLVEVGAELAKAASSRYCARSRRSGRRRPSWP